MVYLYSAGLVLYGFGIRLFSVFSPKAHLWIRGRRNLLLNMARELEAAPAKRFWVHCASLGEFELGKPLIKKLRERYPGYRIVLTFFSPSGYEQSKNTPVADHVFYLPSDSRRHARRLLDAVRPSMAFFVKNDFWHFYIRELHKRNIPVYLVSVRFLPSQIHFTWFGQFFKKIIRRATHIFVNDQRSLELMYDHGLVNVTVSGDMRFDSVHDRKENAGEHASVGAFGREHTVLVAGSTWPADEKLLAALLPLLRGRWKMLIAPHEIHESRLSAIEKLFNGNSIRFSKLKSGDNGKAVLIIDNIGMLADLYRFAKYAYVGGAFGRGLHNILEAVVYGVPVFFGPRIRRFPEAVELTAMKTAFAVRSAGAMSTIINKLESDQDAYARIHEDNLQHAKRQIGALQVVMNHLELNFVNG